MGVDTQVLCPRCKSPDNLRKVCDVYQHYQNKEAVKKFFGEDVCLVPDYLKDADLELLEKKDEYELTQGEVRVADDATSDFSDMGSEGSEQGRDHLTGGSQEINLENISPPKDPPLVQMSLVLMVPLIVGTSLLALSFASAMMNIKLLLAAHIALIAGLSILIIVAVIFIAVSFHNANLLRDYEASRSAWKKKIVCNHCRTVFAP
ncbi:MAG TPA: hypothetical protein VMD52_00265 [Patescibacteria group bacterium]|nr:hypothetical protein [Patescibacteria group bacterium]